MRTIKILFILLLAATLLSACSYGGPPFARVDGSGQVVTETRNVSGITSVNMNGAGKLYIERTGSESLSITTDSNLLPYMITEVRSGGVLYIGGKPGMVFGRFTDFTVRLTVKDLKGMDLNGAVAADVSGLDTDQFQVSLNGASAVRVSGKADRQTVTLSGAGGYNGENLESRSAQVSNSGAGAAIVRVSAELNAQISGMGYIEYIGNPSVQKTVAGIGVVRQR